MVVSSKTLINGTAYNIARGRTRINGTGYTIKKGRTRIGGTGYNILLSALKVSQVSYTGSYPPSGGYAKTYTETSSLLKAEMVGSPTQNSTSNSTVGTCGFQIQITPNVPVKITWSGNTGGSYVGTAITNELYGDTDEYYTSKTAAHANTVTTIAARYNKGSLRIHAYNGNKNFSDVWVSISKIEVDDVQVFPVV